MQRLSVIVSLTAMAVSLIAILRSAALPMAGAADPDTWRAERTYPPLVFTSTAWLDCSISSTANGRQEMRTTSGQGFSFATPMKPIKKSLLELIGHGMRYKFDAFPSTTVPAAFTGLGKGAITSMKAEVEVDVRRYRQTGGPGTTIRFSAGDIRPDSAYVEFTGVFVRSADKKRFPFRVVFGSVKDGEGKVQPASKAPKTEIRAKQVVLGTPRVSAPVTTALYEEESDVQRLK